MSEACTDCPVARIHRDRIAELEDRLERAEALLEPDSTAVPIEWCLSPHEALVCRLLARGAVKRATIERALDEHSPREAPRAYAYVSVLVGRVRTKLADFGWVLLPCSGQAGVYRIHPDQQALFADASIGRGEPAHPSIVKPKKPEALT